MMKSTFSLLTRLEMFDDWDRVLYINMFGCDRYGYYDLWSHQTSPVACGEARAAGHGYVVFVYFFVVVVYGGIVMQVRRSVGRVAVSASARRAGSCRAVSPPRRRCGPRVGCLCWSPAFRRGGVFVALSQRLRGRFAVWFVSKRSAA